MANSLMQLVSDGNLSVVPLTIKFFAQAHIKVFVDGVVLPSPTYSYTWSGANTLTISPNVASGGKVEILRQTPADYILHEFQAGAVFSEVSIDENFLQELYLLQEAKEQSFITDLYANLDMHNNRIVNMGDAVDMGDAVTLRQLIAGGGGGGGGSSNNGIFFYTFTATQGQVEYSLPVALAPGTVPLVFLRGVYQQYNVAYTVDPSGRRRILFSAPLSAGDVVQVTLMSGADAITKGDYVVFLYTNAPTTPTTPIGDTPPGWLSYPTTPESNAHTWVTTGLRDGGTGSLVGGWSTPSRITGAAGPVGASGVGVVNVELISTVGKVATYHMLLTNGTYSTPWSVTDGADGLGSVASVNGVSPIAGNVTLVAADVGAHSVWENDSANTGTLGTSGYVRWLADSSAPRNRTLGATVTDFCVKDVTGTAGTNPLTITAPSARTINGAASETIDVNFGWANYTLVGTDYKIVGGQ